MMNLMGPLVADVVLTIVYIVLGAALLVTALSVVRTLQLRRKEGQLVNGIPQRRIAVVVAVAFVLTLALTFALGSTEPVVSNGVAFTNPTWLRLIDTFLNTALILILGCFVGALVSKFRS